MCQARVQLVSFHDPDSRETENYSPYAFAPYVLCAEFAIRNEERSSHYFADYKNFCLITDRRVME